MKVYDLKVIRNRTSKAQRKGRRFVVVLVIMFVFAGLLGYLFFFSGIFEIYDVVLEGVETVDPSIIISKADDAFSHTLFGFIKPQRNILFFDTKKIKDELFADIAVIEDVEIEKNFFHEIKINVTERQPYGVWCFASQNPNDTHCKYFDEDGVSWSSPLNSYGLLMLTIEDYRKDRQQVDEDYLIKIKEVIKYIEKIDFSIDKISIIEDSFRDFRVHSKDKYYLIFNVDSNIRYQIGTLKILLEENSENSDFNPKYIDLRIKDRVYYK